MRFEQRSPALTGRYHVEPGEALTGAALRHNAGAFRIQSGGRFAFWPWRISSIRRRSLLLIM